MSPSLRFLAAAAAVLMIAGCSAVQVRGIGTNSSNPAFDLSGPNLELLTTQAQRLCPQGYAVMREWQRTSRPVGAQYDSTPALASGLWAFTYDQPPDQAQMSIVCRPPTPA
jgi:hypothetical protein